MKLVVVAVWGGVVVSGLAAAGAGAPRRARPAGVRHPGQLYKSLTACQLGGGSAVRHPPGQGETVLGMHNKRTCADWLAKSSRFTSANVESNLRVSEFGFIAHQ